MTEIHPLEAPDDRYARWVAMWQAAVRSSQSALGLTELSTARFIELSPRGAEVLGTTVEDGIGLSYLAVVDDRRAAVASFRLARDGILDGSWTRRRLRRPDGSVIELQTTGWTIRSSFGPDLGLWMPSEVDPAERALAEDVVAPSFPHQSRWAIEGDRVTIDGAWRVTHIDPGTDSILGRPAHALLGTSLLELTHPDDLPALLFALARATTDRSARALVRLRHQDGTWRVIQVAPTVLDGEETMPAAFVLAAWDEPNASESRGWASEVPGHLRRIADQIEAAGVLAPSDGMADARGFATTVHLSARQWEIVARLVRGARVATIAAELYLSPSTVRNHLSAIFAKVGVHSQVELLALFRGQSAPGGMDPAIRP